MDKNRQVNLEVLEGLAACGVADTDNENSPQSVIAVVSAIVKICLPAISAVTTFFSCNKSCGWGC